MMQAGVLCSLIFVLSLLNVTSHASCGVGFDHLMKEHQSIHSQARRLVGGSIDYDTSSGAFLSLAAAKAVGNVAPIRIKALWEVVEGGDYTGSNSGSNARQCSSVGATIQVQPFGGGGLQSWSGCSEKHVVPKDGPRYNVMKARTNFATNYWTNLLTIKPVRGPIVIDSTVRSQYNLQTVNVTDADLVLIMLARPSPFAPVAGYAGCVQSDQYGRCVVGIFNWVPEVLDVDKANSPDTIATERHTALHEVVHVLGGMSPGGDSRVFIDEFGNSKPDDQVYTTNTHPGYGRPQTLIITPKVVAKAREQFGCPTLEGVALEDQPLGKGSHWEARIMGSELMSYGSMTGEAYVSDITLAFLEDTNQYIANYTNAGRFVESQESEVKMSSFSFLQRDKVVETPAAPRSNGYIRWGRDAGCDFVNARPVAWEDRYKCEDPKDHGCTADNRMSARCIIVSGRQLPNSKEYSCGTFTNDQPDCDVTLNDNCPGGNCELPTQMQYFTQAQVDAMGFSGGATPSNTAGHSSAMDYAPVRVGYWNCQDSQPAGQAGLADNEGASVNLSFVSKAKEDMDQFGGQSYCPDCRCFTSSLVGLSKGFNPAFPRYGLCYRANCFRKDYLQVAIRGQVGSQTFWYKCPQEGGKLYIPGFSGAFHCPPAEEFCRFEDASGIRYPETQLWWEWLFWGLLIGVPLLFLLLCGCSCIREKIVRRCKRCCGVTHFADKTVLLQADGRVSESEELPVAPPRGPGNVLLFLNALVLAVDIVFLAWTIYGIVTDQIDPTAASPSVVFGVVVLIVAIMGMAGSRKRAKGASCLLVTYFYIMIVSIYFLLFTATYVVLFPDSINTYVERNWDTVSDRFSDEYNESDPREKQQQDVADALRDQMYIGAGLAFGVVLLMLIAAVVTARILGRKVVIGSMATVLTNLILLGSIAILAFGLFLIVEKEITGNLTEIGVLTAAFGGFFLVSSIVGLIGLNRKSSGMVGLYTLLMVLSLGALVYLCYRLFVEADDASSLVDKLSDDELSDLSNLFNLAMSRKDFEAAAEENMRLLGVALALLGACMIMLIICLAFFIKETRRASKATSAMLVAGHGPNHGRSHSNKQIV